MKRSKKDKNKKERKAKAIIGIAWFRKDQWKKLCDVSADKDTLENTYEEWVSQATKTINDLISKGIHIEKIDVDVNELIDWCIHQKCPINGESRSSFVADRVREKYQDLNKKL